MKNVIFMTTPYTLGLHAHIRELEIDSSIIINIRI